MTSDVHDAELSRSIQALYAVFEPRRLRVGFPARCAPTGDRQAVAERLASTPLHTLDADDLDVYASKAMLTMGDVEDFVHFAPRMLEVYASACPRPYGVFRALGLRAADALSEHERDAVRVFVALLWRRVIAGRAAVGVATFLSDLGEAGIEVTSLLAAWTPESHGKGLVVLLELIETWERILGSAGVEVMAWLGTPSVGAALERAFDDEANEAIRERVIAAHTSVRG